jgi:hypothetical protein
MRHIVEVAVFGWVLLGAWCAPAHGDGGTVRISEKQGGYRVTVFTAPTPLRAGPMDVSVLVQDDLTGDATRETEVNLRLTKAGQPALAMLATPEAATNKLFHAAQFELPEAGRWELQVQVKGGKGLALFHGEFEAAQPVPRWFELVPWVSWPVIVVVFFGVHQVLVHRRLAARGPTLPAEGKRGTNVLRSTDS